MNITSDDCEAMCWIEERAVDAVCSLPPGHSGNHWDHLEGWEW